MSFKKIKILLPKTMQDIEERCVLDREQAFQRYQLEQYEINLKKRFKQGDIEV